MTYHEAFWGASVGAAPVVALGYAVLLGQIRAMPRAYDDPIRRVDQQRRTTLDDLTRDPTAYETTHHELTELQARQVTLMDQRNSTLTLSLWLYTIVTVAMFACGTALLEALLALAADKDVMPPRVAVGILAMSFIGLLTVMFVMNYGEYSIRSDPKS